MTSENAAAPMNGRSCLRISSVAYATDERLSEAKTASAVALFRRSCSSCTVARGGPRSLRFTLAGDMHPPPLRVFAAPQPHAENDLRATQRGEAGGVDETVDGHRADGREA